MVKTIKCLADFERLKSALTEYVRELPSYEKVKSSEFEIEFRGDYSGNIYMSIQQPTASECWACDGKGKEVGDDGEVDVCYLCKGTGKIHQMLRMRIEKVDGVAKVLKIRVETEGKNIAVWKPAVEVVKKFIEGLMGTPCIVIPMSKKEQLANQPPMEDRLQASIDKLKGS